VATLARSPLPSDLREQGALVAAEVVRRNRRALASLGDRDQDRAEAIAYAVAARLLAEPAQRLELLERNEERARVEAVRELFGLGPASGARPS
jgi:glutamyl-tRNA reductase